MKKAVISVLFLTLFFAAFMLCAYADGTKVEVLSLKIESYPTRTVYNAFDSFDAGGLSVSAELSDGSRMIIPTSELSFGYENGDNLRVGDEHIAIYFEGRSAYLPVTVNPISYPTDTAISDITLTYNGEYQSYTAALPTIMGLDGIPLTVKANGGGTSVGEYEIYIDFHTESKNYLTPESRVVKMTIEPMETVVIWREFSFVYDGKSKIPTAEFVDAQGKVRALSVLGGATNAGVYTARVGMTDPNYRFISASCDYEIKKADYDMSSVLWNGTSFVYDGSKRSVTLTGLPKGVSVVSYQGDVASDAGKYTATATLAWDSANYNAPILASHSWEILPAEYDITGFRFLPSTHVFDGNIHYPTLEGKMPVGMDGIALEYSFSSGATHVSDGKVSVIISFRSASKNYNIPKDQYSSVSVTPKGINVSWSGEKLYYNGERQSPVASAKECGVRVNGAAMTVGRYTATAESQNSDFFIINDSLEFEILKAVNGWRVVPSASTCYEGREIRLVGESKFGTVKYSFYSDPKGTEKISPPTEPGRYYARLTVEESMNYGSLVSNVISFEIVKILPVSFVAEIDGASLVAFGVILAKDITCSVVNNDGSREAVDSSLVSVVYQNGDSLRKGDTSVTLVYEKFSLTLPVKVDFADYDMSDVRWENISATYTGSPLSPKLSGLPEGVSVLSFSQGEMINAGVYIITPIFSYDSENYHAPTVTPCQFTIEKKALIPDKITSVYNGKYQIPTSDSLLYTVESAEGFREVGTYALTLRLTDSTNYVFAASGGERVNGLFEITPATIGIRVKDTTLHLFEKLKGAEYFVTSGTVFANDYVGLGFYIDGGRVLAVSENPNYVLDVIGGELIRLPYPTIYDGIWLFGALLLILLIIIGMIFLYRKRARLATVIGIIKCRIKHRHFKVADPIDEPRVTESPNPNEKARQSAFYDEKISIAVDEGHADMLITDPQAKSLMKKEGDVVYTEGTERARITVGEISDAFSAGDRVDINVLKDKGLVSSDANNLKVIGGGKIDKSLSVYANDFTLSAIKMIALSGGQAIKCVTLRGRTKEKE